MQELAARHRGERAPHRRLARLLEARSERALRAMERAPDLASAANAGQPTPAPQSASARPSSSIGGPSAAFSSVIGLMSMPSDANTARPSAVMPEPWVP